MQRIHVTGNAGVGKSTVASIVAKILDIERISLDSVVWRSGWERVPMEEHRMKELEICSKRKWVVDGVSKNIREAADTIIFLDYPRRVSFLRCTLRNWRYLFRSRPDLPVGCPEILIVPKLVRMIWQFPKVVRPKILADISAWQDSKRIIHIRTNAELRNF